MIAYRGRPLHVPALVSLALLSHSAMALQLEEVVVTAQKRAESIQDVPISITAFSGDELNRRGLTDISRLASAVPNFDVPTSNTARNVSVRIRGIGSSGTNPGIESSVGVFLDGLYQPTGAMVFGELSDIASFEILRGPQGTLYGRNTPVGALNVTTLAPSEEFESKITLGYGDYSEVTANGYVGGALSENTAGRLSFWYRDREGYQHNLFTDDDVNGTTTWGLRGKMLFTPSDNVDINVIASYSEIDSECCTADQIDPSGPTGIATPGFLATQAAAGLPFENFDDSDHVVDGDEIGDDKTESLSFSVQVDWAFANEHTLTSITGYQDWENDVTIASDSLKNNVLPVTQIQKNEIYSQEFRITSPADQTLEYLAGVYLYGQDTEFTEDAFVASAEANRVFPVPSPPCQTPCAAVPGDTINGLFDQETRSVAVYGNMTYHISEQWDITGGLRWSQDEKDVFIDHANAPGNGFVIDRLIFPANTVGNRDLSENSTTWSINTRFRPAEDLMLFATASTGFKSGGFNSRRLPPGTPVQFANEDSITFEAGIKSTLLDQRLRLNATVYQTTIEDFQESALAPSGTGFIVGNAGEQEARGIELDFTFLATEQLAINGAFAFLDAEYTEFVGAQCGIGEAVDDPVANTCDRSGETPAFAPEVTWNLGAEWTQPLANSDMELRFRADYSWIDEQNRIRVTQDAGGDTDSYGLLNLRAVLAETNGKWQVEAYVNNVSDETYFIQAARQPLGGLISGGGPAGARGFVGWYGAPRTWGLQVTFYPGS